MRAIHFVTLLLLSIGGVLSAQDKDAGLVDTLVVLPDESATGELQRAERLKKKLADTTVTFDLQDTPLNEALKWLSEETGIPFGIDERVESIVEPESWKPASRFIDVTSDGLIVRNRRDIQRQVMRFARQLGLEVDAQKIDTSNLPSMFGGPKPEGVGSKAPRPTDAPRQMIMPMGGGGFF
ncbi:hypothetical protein GC197_05600 [bacterium]|nr:hypothetical protein [bacterium]